MGFSTELFSRPRPHEEVRYRPGLALLYAMNNADRCETGVKPPDFPRLAHRRAPC